jgi:hypothetical protein
VTFFFGENNFTPKQFDMIITVNISEEESVSPIRPDKGGASSEHIFSPANAVALCSHQLDNALSKHKKEQFEEIDIKNGLQQCEKPKSSVTTPKFKFEGTARRYEFNCSRIDEVSKARVLLEQRSIATAEKILDQCEKALKEHNTIIRIADIYGWDVVEEYVDDPLTNSTDTTKLHQTEYRAKLKRRERQINRYNLITRNKTIPTRIRLILFIALAQHVKEKHLEPIQEPQPVPFIQRRSITEVQKQQKLASAFIVT